MRRKIISWFQALWNWLRRTLADKCGEFPFRDVKPGNEHTVQIIERDVVVNNINVHIKSIFTGKTSLDSALKNIVARKMSDTESEH